MILLAFLYTFSRQTNGWIGPPLSKSRSEDGFTNLWISVKAKREMKYFFIVLGALVEVSFPILDLLPTLFDLAPVPLPWI